MKKEVLRGRSRTSLGLPREALTATDATAAASPMSTAVGETPDNDRQPAAPKVRPNPRKPVQGGLRTEARTVRRDRAKSVCEQETRFSREPGEKAPP